MGLFICQQWSKDVNCELFSKVDGSVFWVHFKGVGDEVVRGFGDEVDIYIGDKFGEGVELEVWGNFCIDKDIKDEFNMKNENSVDWEDDSKLSGEVGRGDDNGLYSVLYFVYIRYVLQVNVSVLD